MKKFNCNYLAIIFFATSTLVAEETEEIIAVASYIESSEFNASPVDVISAEEFKNLRKFLQLMHWMALTKAWRQLL